MWCDCCDFIARLVVSLKLHLLRKITAMLNAKEYQLSFKSKVFGLPRRALSMVPAFLKSQRNKSAPKISDKKNNLNSVSTFLSARDQWHCVNKRWRKKRNAVYPISHYKPAGKHHNKMPVLLFQQSKDERKGWMWILLVVCQRKPSIRVSNRILYSCLMLCSDS